MGSYKFIIDPNAKNKAALQKILNELSTVDNIATFLKRPGSDEVITLTDNLTDTSIVMSPRNKSDLLNAIQVGKPARGLSQEKDGFPKAIYLAIPPVDEKHPVHVLIHEIGHKKWPGLGTRHPHDPLFYKILKDTLDALGLIPDPLLDLNEHTFKELDALPKPYGDQNVLEYFATKNRTELFDDMERGTKYANGESWKFVKTANEHFEMTKYDSSGTKIMDKIQLNIGAKGLGALNDFNTSDGSYVRTTYDRTNGFEWDSKRQFYDPNKKLIKTELNYKDGSYDIIDYKPYDKDDISTITAHYDTNNKPISSLVVHDDGRREYYKSDLYNKYDWSLEQESFDAEGHKISRKIVADNGDIKLEKFDLISTNGYSEPNNPSSIEYYESTGAFIRLQKINYATIYKTDQHVLSSIKTYDTNNYGMWNSVEYYFNNDGSLRHLRTVYDNGSELPGVDGGFFTNKWDFAAPVDSNQVMRDFNPYIHFDSKKATSFDIPKFADYNPIFQFVSNYTGYKALDFGGITTFDAYKNIYLLSDNPYDYVDFADPSKTYGPVVLDIDGDGVAISSLGHNSAKFDTDGDGLREQTAWVGPKDGILVYDLPANTESDDADDIISSPKELNFASWLNGGLTNQSTDVSALREIFDTNHDGNLSKQDTNFENFKVWIDANSDGVSQTGELFTLSKLGVESISLSTTGNMFVLQDGTKIHGVGSYTKSDGASYALADIAFSVSTDPSHIPLAPDIYTINMGNEGIYDIKTTFRNLDDFS